MPKVTELVSGGAGLEGTHTDMCTQQARTLTLVHASVQASDEFGVPPARLSAVCALLGTQAVSVSDSRPLL